jgi:hypothetical protein
MLVFGRFCRAGKVTHDDGDDSNVHQYIHDVPCDNSGDESSDDDL